MPILALEKVSKSFGAVTAAEAVSFAVESGEALGIIGPNGAGKSTLFNLITGNIGVDAGKILFDGSDITHSPPMRRCVSGIGRTFQIPQPFEKLTVFENVLTAAMFGTESSQAEVGERSAMILVETGLLRHANEPAGRLTLLQRKRLELARALATEPKMLLLDEIAGGLTEGECGTLVELICSIHARGVSIVWIEHVLHALTSVVSRLVVLDFGKVIGMGAPAEIMQSREVREIYLGIEV